MKKKLPPVKLSDAMDEKLLDQMKSISLDNKDQIQEDLNSILHSDAEGFKFQDFKIMKKLGKGAFGEVDLVQHIPTEKEYAMKKISMVDDEQFKKQLSWELKALISCDSPNIVKYYGAFYENGVVYILLEYMDFGSMETLLKKALDKKEKIPEVILGWITYSVLTGLHYLNKVKKVIHRDIKPGNVLINSKGQVKLCDLGICGKLEKTLAMKETFVGTTIYMSPERLQGKPYNVATDIWSLGIALIEAKIGTHPLTVSGQTEFWDILKLIESFEVPKMPDDTHAAVEDFMKQSCIQNPDERPIAETLLEHKFVKKFGKDPEKFQTAVEEYLKTFM